jgi:hypothetical protein
MKISEIKPNPDNPRVIKDNRFEKLCKSIQEFPKMMSLRPMVVDNDMIVLGGNMRLRALQHLGYKEIPDEWVRKADELTEDEKKRFIIVDNTDVGEWDYEALRAWDQVNLDDWGVSMPDSVDINFDSEPKFKDDSREKIIIVIDPKEKRKLINALNDLKSDFETLQIYGN